MVQYPTYNIVSYDEVISGPIWTERFGPIYFTSIIPNLLCPFKIQTPLWFI